MITLIAITAFTSGAVMGHLRALKASQQDLFNAHQAGFYKGRDEQARKIQALQHRVIHLEADARRLPVACGGTWEQ
jgi:hypothetical protein